MDEYTSSVLLGIGVLIALGILWAVWKFFFSLFKHVLLAVLLGAVGSAVYYYYRSSPSPREPNFGKHAYSKISGQYLGVV